MASARSSNGFGANPIGFAEIAAWANLTSAMPSPWEISVLRRIDSALLPLINSKADKQLDGEPEPEFEVAANDDEGVRELFAGLKARAAAKFGKS